jgi:nitrite reductase/ring-hydroxylating ferredoxin subunit
MRTDPDNPARPAPGTRLCGLDEIPSPGALGFRFREDAAVFAGVVVRKNGQLFGYVDSCPHAGWPLAGPSGRFLTRENDLTLFRIEDGACVAGPCSGESLAPWPVRLDGGDVLTA